MLHRVQHLMDCKCKLQGLSQIKDSDIVNGAESWA